MAAGTAAAALGGTLQLSSGAGQKSGIALDSADATDGASGAVQVTSGDATR